MCLTKHITFSPFIVAFTSTFVLPLFILPLISSLQYPSFTSIRYYRSYYRFRDSFCLRRGRREWPLYQWPLKPEPQRHRANIPSVIPSADGSSLLPHPVSSISQAFEITGSGSSASRLLLQDMPHRAHHLIPHLLTLHHLAFQAAGCPISYRFLT